MPVRGKDEAYITGMACTTGGGKYGEVVSSEKKVGVREEKGSTMMSATREGDRATRSPRRWEVLASQLTVFPSGNQLVG